MPRSFFGTWRAHKTCCVNKQNVIWKNNLPYFITSSNINIVMWLSGGRVTCWPLPALSVRLSVCPSLQTVSPGPCGSWSLSVVSEICHLTVSATWVQLISATSFQQLHFSCCECGSVALFSPCDTISRIIFTVLNLRLVFIIFYI
jgi:hypothetical protein